MAKAKIEIGSEMEYVSPSELRDEIGRVVDAVWLLQPPDIEQRSTFVTTDANGAVGALGDTVHIFTCPAGFRADILRIGTWINGSTYTPANPLTNGWLSISRNDATSIPEWWFPGSGNAVVPALYEGGETSPMLRGGERLIVVGAGLPALQQIAFTLGIRLWSDVSRKKFEPSR